MSHPGGTPHVGQSTGGGLDSTTRSEREPALGANLGGGKPGGPAQPDSSESQAEEEPDVEDR